MTATSLMRMVRRSWVAGQPALPQALVDRARGRAVRDACRRQDRWTTAIAARNTATPVQPAETLAR